MDASKTKITISLAMIVIGVALTVVLGSGVSVTEYQSEGTVIDFSQYEVAWTEMDLDGINACEALEQACEEHSYSLTFNDSGEIVEIDGVFSDRDNQWNLWVIEDNSVDWMMLIAPYDSYDLKDYRISSWSYRAVDGTPTVALDASGTPIYGYPQKDRSITLTPSITEMVVAVGAFNTIVGTDVYSNYPQSVVDAQRTGDIAIVGDYTSPSFEAILKTHPDVVFCDGQQYNHNQVAQRLKEVSVCTVILYGGESIDVIRDNIFIIGQAMGYDLGAKETLEELDYAVDKVQERLAVSPMTHNVRTVFTLDAGASPWVSGAYSFSNDVLEIASGRNPFDDIDHSWGHINSEQLLARNPSVIIILSYDYEATQEAYDAMIASLSPEWKATDAYKDGKIYLLTEGAGEMAQHSGPRYAQFAELTAMILNPDAFGVELPKYFGSDYYEYLVYSKNLNFE